MKTSPLTLGVIGAVALTIAGCGSGSGKSTTTSSTAAPSTSASATAGGAAATGSSGASAAAGAATVISTKHAGDFGTILASGPRHLTVYLFEADHGSTSVCSGACANAWPPVTTTGQPRASGASLSADLGTITRPDGTRQVTYKGHPLYFFVRDKDGGDTYGQGVSAFGADWYVLAPSGDKVDKGQGSGAGGPS
jgi:predicted lipoprotein with Yx(FWY)xxD motif